MDYCCWSIDCIFGMSCRYFFSFTLKNQTIIWVVFIFVELVRSRKMLKLMNDPTITSDTGGIMLRIKLQVNDESFFNWIYSSNLQMQSSISIIRVQMWCTAICIYELTWDDLSSRKHENFLLFDSKIMVYAISSRSWFNMFLMNAHSVWSQNKRQKLENSVEMNTDKCFISKESRAASRTLAVLPVLLLPDAEMLAGRQKMKW